MLNQTTRRLPRFCSYQDATSTLSQDCIIHFDIIHTSLKYIKTGKVIKDQILPFESIPFIKYFIQVTLFNTNTEVIWSCFAVAINHFTKFLESRTSKGRKFLHHHYLNEWTHQFVVELAQLSSSRGFLVLLIGKNRTSNKPEHVAIRIRFEESDPQHKIID